MTSWSSLRLRKRRGKMASGIARIIKDLTMRNSGNSSTKTLSLTSVAVSMPTLWMCWILSFSRYSLKSSSNLCHLMLKRSASFTSSSQIKLLMISRRHLGLEIYLNRLTCFKFFVNWIREMKLLKSILITFASIKYIQQSLLQPQMTRRNLESSTRLSIQGYIKFSSKRSLKTREEYLRYSGENSGSGSHLILSTDTSNKNTEYIFRKV